MTQAFLPAGTIISACLAKISEEQVILQECAKPILDEWMSEPGWFGRVVLKSKALTEKEAIERFNSDDFGVAHRLRIRNGHATYRAKKLLTLAQAAAKVDGDGAPVALEADDAHYLRDHLHGGAE